LTLAARHGSIDASKTVEPHEHQDGGGVGW